MNSDFSHLSEKAITTLNLSDRQRINRIRSPRWIGYTNATKILDRLEDLLTHPKKHRMPNLLIVGDTNNGKTMLINRFYHRHLPNDNLSGDRIILPVLLIQAPPVPDENRFYNSILETINAPYKASDRPDKKQFQTIRILEQLETQMLMIDEIHHILAGNLNKQRHFLNTIKYLGNELKIPIVGIGTQDAFNAIQTDPQLANRFEPATLPRWEMNSDYERLLASFEYMLPLKQKSNLVDPTIALKILAMSEGILGEISAIITRAAVDAIKTGVEHINIHLLNSIDWIQPSERKHKTG